MSTDPETLPTVAHEVREVLEPDIGLMKVIERNIARSSPQQAAQWLQVRREALAQDQEVADRKHRRVGEITSLAAKVGLSFAGLGAGALLVTHGVVGPGLVCLGAAFTPLAPRLMEQIFSRFRVGTDE